MNRIIVGIVFSVVWFCFPKPVNAVLNSACFTPHYSAYTNYSLSGDTDDIIQTVEVSGYTEALNPAVYMGPQVGWQYPCSNQVTQMQSSTHTSNITNILGASGGAFSQGPTPALAFNDYVVSITTPGTPGSILSSSTEADIFCIVAGTIFLNNLLNADVEIAFTRFVTVGYIVDNSVPPPVRLYFIGPYCTAPTSPPDWNPPSPPMFWKTPEPPPPTVPTEVTDGKTICWRVGTTGPWSCLPVGKWYGSYNRADTVLGNCTHNP